MSAFSSPTPDLFALATTPENLTRLADEQLAAATTVLDGIRALANTGDETLTWDNTFGAADLVTQHLQNAAALAGFFAVGHPNAEMREAAKACEPKASAFATSFYLDATLAAVFKRAAAHLTALPEHRQKFVDDTLREYRRNGLELPEEQQSQLRSLNEQLTELGQAFEMNIAETTGTIRVKPAQLAGLPDTYIATHQAEPDGLVTITTNYPDYSPFITYARDRDAARELHLVSANRAVEKNLPILDEILRLRAEKAALLGYKTWADYVLEPRMAKTSERVRTFLEDLRVFMQDRAKAETEEMRRAWVAEGRDPEQLFASDHLYLEDRVRAQSFAFDSQKIREYFEVTAVKNGIFTIVSTLFGLTFTQTDTPVWHEDVQAYDVHDRTGAHLGSFFLDLYPRSDKYKHAAVFTIQPSKRNADGTRRLPIAIMACNFPKPGTTPALLGHNEVVTFFHEFGHLIHDMVSDVELVSQSGTNTARDFVEAPSQMLEEWAWTRETLDLFALHYQTGEPMPDDLFHAMQQSRFFGIGLHTVRQLFLASLDFEYHTREPGFDTTKVMEELHRAYVPLPLVPGNHFQASFGHLIGYDAGYYSYQWALAIASDLLTRFQAEGMLSQHAAHDYLNTILSKGGSADENKLVERFLGRPTNDAAYKKFLSTT